MALEGPWGTFVHIPKCAGLPVRKWLKNQIGHPYFEVGDFHGMPQLVKCDTFAIVREPTTWVRSMYAYRIRSGYEEEKLFVYNWPIIISMTKWLQQMPWDEFVDALHHYDFDIPLNVYGMYRHPFVKLYKMEKLHKLQKDMGITQPIPHAHVTANKPDWTSQQRAKLRWVCRRSRKLYGYK